MPGPDPHDRPPSRPEDPRLWRVAVGATAALTYLRTVTFGWVYDDQMEVVRNVFIRSWRSLPSIFTSTAWEGSGMETFLYRPVTISSYLVNHAVSGLEPWSYHLANVGLHAFVSILVFQVGRLWRLPVVAAGVGAMIFAVHPVHVEVVAAVFGRRDLLAAVFLLGMVLAHARALDRMGRGWVLAPLCFAGAALSKEVGVVAPALVALQDLYLHGSVGGGRRPGRAMYAAYAAVLLLLLVARFHVTGGFGIPGTSYLDNPLVAASPWARVGTAVAVVGHGIGLLAVPWRLSPDYSFDAFPVVGSMADVRFVGALLILGSVAWVVARSGRRVSLPLLLAGWYAVTLFPASNLVVAVGTIFGERLLYLPSVALSLTAGLAGHGLWARRRGVAAATALVVGAGLALQTARYSSAWSDDVSLFRWAARWAPRSTKAHHKLGEELLRRGDLGPAIRSLDRAIAIAPDNVFAEATLAVARSHAWERYGNGEELPFDADVLRVLSRAARDRGDRGKAEFFRELALSFAPRAAHRADDIASGKGSGVDRGDPPTVFDPSIR